MASASRKKKEMLKEMEFCTSDHDHLSAAIHGTIVSLVEQGKYREIIKLGEDRLCDFAGTPHDDARIRFRVAHAHYMLADRAFGRQREIIREKEYALAMTHLTRLYKADPTDSYVLSLMGRIYVKQHEYTKAIAIFDQQLAVHPEESSVIYGHKANALYQAWNLEEALKVVNQKLALDPHEPYGYDLKSMILIGKGEFEQALAVIEQGFSHHPDRALLHGHKAKALHELGRPAEALNAINRKIELAPDNAAAYGLKAEILVALGDAEGAKQALAHKFTLRPDDRASLRLMDSLNGKSQPRGL